MNTPLRIQDVLMRPVFRGAQLLAGASGLDRPLRWIHILDVLDVRNMLRGGELVLSTGMGFSRSLDDFRSYMEQLIEGKAVGLCMELGTAIKEVPPEILQIADGHGFPLIVFNFQVRFVDITQDVHTLILNRHHRLLDDMEQVAHRHQLFHEQEWVEELIGSDRPERPFVDAAAQNSQAKRYRCVNIHVDGLAESTAWQFDADGRNRQLALSASIRTPFVTALFRPHLSLRRDAIIAVLEYDSSHAAAKPDIGAVIRQLPGILRKNGVDNSRVLAGVGRETSALSGIRQSYQEAATALSTQNATPDADVVFYEDAGIYRWVAVFAEHEQARQLVDDDLKAVLAHDRRHHTNLLETLRAYLDCDRSKQQTADRLFIHRQTLYHRLEQLEQLLEVDLEDPAKRLALHVSVYYHLLHS